MSAAPLRRLDSAAPGFDRELAALIAFEAAQDPAIDATVARIIADVRARGDAALLDYTAQFDRLQASSVAALEISAAELRHAFAALPAGQRTALETAAARIRAFHERQKIPSWTYRDETGCDLGQQVTPLDRVGLYVPGGKAAYPSSVLMNAIPAQVAGVAEIVMVVPTPDGVRNPLVLAAAASRRGGAGVHGGRRTSSGRARVRHGDDSRRRQDLRSRQRLRGRGQAARVRRRRHRHGGRRLRDPRHRRRDRRIRTGWRWTCFRRPNTTSSRRRSCCRPMRRCSTPWRTVRSGRSSACRARAIIAASFANRGALVRVRDLDEACAVANRVAPEHLELAVADPAALVPKIRHAGAIFMGHHASEALGDYCAGPNHVLPTGRTARFSSPLGVYDFQKRTSLLHVPASAARVLGQVAATLADGEGLPAHAQSARYRISAS